MPDYADLDMQTLLDLLIKHTTEYTKMLTSRTSAVEEIARCKKNLKIIHLAIELKHNEGKITILPKGDISEKTTK